MHLLIHKLETLLCDIKKTVACAYMWTHRRVCLVCLAEMWAGCTVEHMMSCHWHQLKIIITPQSRDSAAWVLWKWAFFRDLSSGCSKKVSHESSLSQFPPPRLFLSRICLCCWTSLGRRARALAASSPAQCTGSPDCKTLVIDFSVHMCPILIHCFLPTALFCFLHEHFVFYFEVGRTQFELGACIRI